MSKSITIELTEEQARLLSDGQWPYDDAEMRMHGEVADAARAALAKHRRDAREERLGLPWKAAAESLHISAPEHRGVHWRYPKFYTAEQAQLAASAPDLASALEALLEHSDDTCEGPEYRAAQDAAREALRKSGWVGDV